MSASKSNYPERPSRPGPKKPHKGKGRPSSEHISGKRKIWAERPDARAVKGPRETYDKLDMSRTIFGHAGLAMVAFLKKYRHNRVPIHVWGKKGKTAEA